MAVLSDDQALDSFHLADASSDTATSGREDVGAGWPEHSGGSASALQ